MVETMRRIKPTPRTIGFFPMSADRVGRFCFRLRCGLRAPDSFHEEISFRFAASEHHFRRLASAWTRSCATSTILDSHASRDSSENSPRFRFTVCRGAVVLGTVGDVSQRTVCHRNNLQCDAKQLRHDNRNGHHPDNHQGTVEWVRYQLNARRCTVVSSRRAPTRGTIRKQHERCFGAVRAKRREQSSRGTASSTLQAQ